MSRGGAPPAVDSMTSRHASRSSQQLSRNARLSFNSSHSRSSSRCASPLRPAFVLQVVFYSFLLFAVACNGQVHPRGWRGQSHLDHPVKEGIVRRQTVSAPAPNPVPTILRNFQVTAPVFAPANAKCEQTLMVHSFGNSFGQPFVGQYLNFHFLNGAPAKQALQWYLAVN